MKKIFFLFATLLLFVVGCSESEVVDNEQTNMEPLRVLSLKATMPGDGDVTTRVGLVETGVDDIDVIWQPGDIINLSFESDDGSVVRTVAGVPVTNISANGKQANFEIAIPGEITGTFNLYGVHGAEFESVNSTTVVLPQDQDSPNGTPSDNYLHNVDDFVVLRFAALNITETTSPQVSFEHIGAIIGIWIENIAMDVITVKEFAFEATDGKDWLNNIGGEATYNLKTNSFVAAQPSSLLNIRHAPTVFKEIYRGQLEKYFRWVVPIDFQSASEIPAALTVTFTDNDNVQKLVQIPAKKLLPGRYYRIKFYHDTSFKHKKPTASNGLMSHWTFDGNAADIVGGNNGTVHGDVTLTANRNGTPNSAYQFDGKAGDYIVTAQTGVVGSEARTISFWARADDISSTNLQTVMAYGDDPIGYGARFEVSLDIEEVVTDISGAYYGMKSNAIVTGVWNFYTVVFEGIDGIPAGESGVTLTQGVKFYVNGVLLTTFGRSFGNNPVITNSEYPIYFGSLLNDGRFFKGAIDDVKMYRRALDASEVMTMYNN